MMGTHHYPPDCYRCINVACCYQHYSCATHFGAVTVGVALPPKSQVAGIIVQPLEAVFQDASCFGIFDYGEHL